jgi:antitoxin (DNA-binding transcriptional repressor) of toxin-antitoxin stability system
MRLSRIHAIGARNLFRWDVRTVCGLGVLGCVIPSRTPSLKSGRLEEQGATVEVCGPVEHSTLLRNKFRAPTASFRLRASGFRRLGLEKIGVGAGCVRGGIDISPTWTQNVHMKTATVRDLRNNFAMLEAWLSNGEDVCIEKRGEPVAMLTAMRLKAGKTLKKPDFAARRKAIWGDRVFSDAEVKAMREAELEGEEG